MAKLILNYSTHLHLKIICKHVGQIVLASPVVNEIKELAESDCVELGSKIIEPDSVIILSILQMRL